MHYTIYKITNQIDGKFYIGSHKTKNLNDNYMGSGKYLKRAIKKYGIENFTKEILFIFDTAEQMYVKESQLVNEDFLATENTYNLKVGGFGGFDYINSTTNTQERIKFGQKGGLKSWENKKISIEGVLNHKTRCGEMFNKLRLEGKLTSSGFKGKKHSDETKTKISQKNKLNKIGEKNPNYGKMWITDGVVNKTIPSLDIIPQGFRKGKTQKKK